jgi:hypothetical protein
METWRWYETFTITDIEHVATTYDPSLNDDPEHDSDGTAITVFRPWIGYPLKCGDFHYEEM